MLKVALAEHGFEPPERIWNADGPHVMRLVDEGAQLSWLHYAAANPVDAGLVKTLEEYPGHVTAPERMQGARLAVERPPFYCDRRTCPDELEVHYSPPPLLDRAFGSPRPIVHHLRRALRATEQACRKRSAPVLGPLAVARQHPWTEPRSPRTFRPGPVPCFMVTGSTELRVQCAREATAFRRRHARCRKDRLAGDDPEFPYGTYAMRVFHRARVEDPGQLTDAVLNAPGPLEPSGSPKERKALQALTSALRAAAAEPSDPDDILAQRLLRGEGDAVERRFQPPAERPVLSPGDHGGDSAGDAIDDPAPRPAPKRVVLRDSTRSARERRGGRHRPSRRDEPELDPPPDLSPSHKPASSPFGRGEAVCGVTAPRNIS